jgi:hypothetical protein
MHGSVNTETAVQCYQITLQTSQLQSRFIFTQANHFIGVTLQNP